jgi:hypothetical protein
VLVPPLRKVDARIIIAECRQALNIANNRQRNVKKFYEEVRASVSANGVDDAER